jgi:hypothetical protein
MNEKLKYCFSLYLKQSRGFGHVEFTNKQGVEKALTKAGSNVDGRPI